MIYAQTDGNAMSSLLGPVMAGTFMVAFEKNVVPQVSLKMTS